MDFKCKSTLVWDMERSNPWASPGDLSSIFKSFLSTWPWEALPYLACSSISAILALISSSLLALARTSAIFLSCSVALGFSCSSAKFCPLYFSSISSLAYFWSSLLRSGLILLSSSFFLLPAAVTTFSTGFSCWTKTVPVAGWIREEALWSKTGA